MKLEISNEILNNLRISILIVDEHDTIKWINNWAKDMLSDENVILNNNFYSYFFTNKNILENNYVGVISNKVFTYKEYVIKCDKNKYKLIILHDKISFKEDENKIYCYENILNLINDGILLSDYQGYIRVVNEAQEKIENFDRKNIINKYLSDVYVYESEEDLEHKNVYSSQKPLLNRYTLFKYKEGRPKYVNYNTYPIIKDNSVMAVFTISKNEEKLQELLGETIELKRKLVHKNEHKNQLNNQSSETRYTFSDIIGDSEITKNLIKEAQIIATLDRNVLIIGETGTGKEVYAQSIHNYVKIKDPFIPINCAAIPENLLESILFGSVKGAYTGAVESIGLFQEAKSGTLFLDELNSMTVSMQTKLLRVLQERKIRKVGDVKTYPIQCRVICAVNENPKKLINNGFLRKDLFYRISGMTLNIPPLRERLDDIKSLIYHYINIYNDKMNKYIKFVEPELELMLLKYKWPGNVRELEYFVENIMIKVDYFSNTIGLKDVNDNLKDELLADECNSFEKEIKNTGLLSDMMDTIERKIVLQKLKEFNWNITHTAKKLGIVRQSLLYKMKKLNIIKYDDK